MGRSSDKLYITSTEWAQDFGGAKKKRQTTDFKRLPFYCCALSLRPADNPCRFTRRESKIRNIIPWIKKYGKNPVTSTALDAKDLIHLHLQKSANEEYHCPVTFKVFNDNSHIVAIKTTGNVYAFDAIDKLCFKTKNLRDLINDEPFTKKDLDPLHLEMRNINSFDYIKRGLKPENPSTDKQEAPKDNSSVAKILGKLAKAEQPKLTPSFINSRSTDNASVYSTGKTAMSFTSTSLPVRTATETVLYSDLDVMFRKLPKNSKGYVSIQTNYGDFNVELFASEAPMTCYNFIMLAKSGFYKQATFHRKIAGFMIQGGLPADPANAGKSHFGEPFEDEIDKRLVHDSRGLLSMANKGNNTNTCQFFVLYSAAPHLNGKHSVFGKVINGHEWLDKTESLAVDVDDKLIEPVQIFDISVYKDPFQDFDLQNKEKERLLKEKQDLSAARKKRRAENETTDTFLPSTGPIGKYLKK